MGLFQGGFDVFKIAGNVLGSRSASMGAGAGIGAITGLASSDSNIGDNIFGSAVKGAAAGALGGLAVNTGIRGGIKGAKFAFTKGSAFAKAKYQAADAAVQAKWNAVKGAGVWETTKSVGAGIWGAPGAAYQGSKQAYAIGQQIKGKAEGIVQKSLYGLNMIGDNAGKIALGGAGLGALYMASQNNEAKSPTMSGVQLNADYNQQAAMAQDMFSGISPMGQMGSAPQMMSPMHRAMQQSTQGVVQGLHRGRHG